MGDRYNYRVQALSSANVSWQRYDKNGMLCDPKMITQLIENGLEVSTIGVHQTSPNNLTYFYTLAGATHFLQILRTIRGFVAILQKREGEEWQTVLCAGPVPSYGWW